MKVQSFKNDREAIAAGRFYPGTSSELTDEINKLSGQAEKLVNTKPPAHSSLCALIVPHAGYVFSGAVAASAYNFLNDTQNIQRVFIIGSSHTSFFDYASVFQGRHYNTPLGPVKIDNEVVSQLLNRSDIFQFLPEAHAQEHSIEVQIPFLQHKLGDKFAVIPIIIGTHNPDKVRETARLLRPWFAKEENLFVISTDLSHYPSYSDAYKYDKQLIEVLCRNNVASFLKQKKQTESKHIPGLSTNMCGWTSVLTLLCLTEGNKSFSYTPIVYQNSGDTAIYGDKARVVGYQSVMVSKQIQSAGESMSLSDEEKTTLLRIAWNSIEENLEQDESQSETSFNISDKLEEPLGAFVSIYVKGELRGCIGRISSEDSLHHTVKKMAVAAAFSDTRFERISRSEIEQMSIEISVLSPLRKIKGPEDIIPGKHGILIRNEYTSGTFLPQVADKTGWNAVEMLTECSEKKAGLGRNGWKSADVFTYEAQIFSTDTD